MEMRSNHPREEKLEMRSNLSVNENAASRQGLTRPGVAGGDGAANRFAAGMGPIEGMPAKVMASVGVRCGEYDARRLRSQREIIRDVMLSAADCDTWLTLGELRTLTQYGEASISAQLRHLRKMENGGYDVAKRHREDALPARVGADGRSEGVWEYRIAR